MKKKRRWTNKTKKNENNLDNCISRLPSKNRMRKKETEYFVNKNMNNITEKINNEKRKGEGEWIECEIRLIPSLTQTKRK